MPGTFIRSSAIIDPGMFLSQPPRHSTPSMNCDCAAVSIASAITSRDTSEYFMPSVPIEMPSVTVGKPKLCGIAPAARNDVSARAASGPSPALQGFIVEWPLAIPTIGLPKSRSVKPTARSIARFGERATPSVMDLLRRLGASVMGPVFYVGAALAATSRPRALLLGLHHSQVRLQGLEALREHRLRLVVLDRGRDDRGIAGPPVGRRRELLLL